MYGEDGSGGVVLAKSNAAIVLSICGGSTQASTAVEKLASYMKSQGISMRIFCKNFKLNLFSGELIDFYDPWRLLQMIAPLMLGSSQSWPDSISKKMKCSWDLFFDGSRETLVSKLRISFFWWKKNWNLNQRRELIRFFSCFYWFVFFFLKVSKEIKKF